MLDHPELRERLLYKVNGMTKIHTSPMSSNLCWMVGILQAGFDKEGMTPKEVDAFRTKVLQPVCKWLTDNFDATNVHRFTFARGEDGRPLDCSLPQSEIFPIEALYEAAIRRIRLSGVLGDVPELVLLATIKQRDIVVHMRKYDSDIPGETIARYPPLGMRRGDVGGELHVYYDKPNKHYSTILGIGNKLTENERDLDKLKDRAIAYLESLAAKCSIESLRASRGSLFNEELDLPIKKRDVPEKSQHPPPRQVFSGLDDLTAAMTSMQQQQLQSMQIMASLQATVSNLASEVAGMRSDSVGDNGDLAARLAANKAQTAELERKLAEAIVAAAAAAATASAKTTAAGGSASSLSASADASPAPSTADAASPVSVAAASPSSADAAPPAASAATAASGGDDTAEHDLPGGAAASVEQIVLQCTNMLRELGTLLNADCDDMCKEHVFKIVPGTLSSCEPENRKDTLDKVNKEVADALKVIIHSKNKSQRTRMSNDLLGRLLAYTSGHVTLATEDISSMSSQQLQEPMSPVDQRTYLDYYWPLMTVLNPKLSLDEHTLTSSRFYDVQAARNVLAATGAAPPPSRCQ